MSDPNTKGRALEAAVHAIEHLILLSSGVPPEKLTITPRKRLHMNGAMHEFDLWVEVTAAPGYSCLVVIECKNWEASVGKSEVMLLSAKASLAGAARAFLVAKDFTRDAVQLASHTPALELLHADALPLEELRRLWRLIVGTSNIAIAELRLHYSKQAAPALVAYEDAILLPLATPGHRDVKEWLDKLARDIAYSHVDALPLDVKLSGTHSARVSGHFVLSAGSYSSRDDYVTGVTMAIDIQMWTAAPPVIAGFEVKTRGMALQFGDVTFGDGSMITGLLVAQRAYSAV